MPFKLGQSGNPAGRKPGSRNRKTIAADLAAVEKIAAEDGINGDDLDPLVYLASVVSQRGANAALRIQAASLLAPYRHSRCTTRRISQALAIEAKHGMRPQMRMGINTGLAVVTQIRGESANATALGDTVNLASRLQTLAEPGTVLLSEATNRLVQGLVDTSFTGEHSIKGKAEPQKAYRLDSILQGATRFEAAISRGLSAFVGRERELEVLERNLEKARSLLCVVDLVAEPGMGKSRLLHEFRHRIGKDRAFILSGSCSPDGQQTPFLPFIEVVRGSFASARAKPRRISDKNWKWV